MKMASAILTSDWHLREKTPLARKEENWGRVQKHYFKQIEKIALTNCCVDCPILFAGDLFDKWNSIPACINNAMYCLENLKGRIHTIPGQHDIPNHAYDQLDRSAYWTLVEAGFINHLSPGIVHEINEIMIHPFPWGHKVIPCRKKNTTSLVINVALIHSYIWTMKTGHVKADKKSKVSKWYESLKGYDVAVFGDNHKGFVLPNEEKTTIVNCGGFIRQHSDQTTYKPFVTLLYANGEVKKKYLDYALDEFSNLSTEIGQMEKNLGLDLTGFIEELATKQNEGIKFKSIILKYAEENKLGKEVINFIQQALESIHARRN